MLFYQLRQRDHSKAAATIGYVTRCVQVGAPSGSKGSMTAPSLRTTDEHGGKRPLPALARQSASVLQCHFLSRLNLMEPV